MKFLPKNPLAITLCLLAIGPASICLAAGGSVVRRAPELAWHGAGGKTFPLKKLLGQPVVFLVAPTADAGEFRKQAARFEKQYVGFAAKKAVFIAAFSAPASPRPESNIPFVMAADGPRTAAAFNVGAGKFACIVIGPDGNVDFQSDHVEGAQRVIDVMNNSFQPQAAERKSVN